MNDLTGLIPVLYAALQIVSRELVGIIPAAARNMTAQGAALGQPIRVPVTPEVENQDIVPGTRPVNGGTIFNFVDMMITKNKIARPIVWNGDEEISVGSQLNQLLVNQYAQAMRSLVNEVEADVCLEAALGAAASGHIYGGAGLPAFASNLTALAAVKKIMDDAGAPLAGRNFVINTGTGMGLRGLQQLTNVDNAGENDMLRRGVLNNLMGYAVRESGGFRPIASPGGTVTLAAGGTKGASALTVAALSSNLPMGTIISLGGGFYTVAAPASAADTSILIAPALIEDVANATVGTVSAAYTANVAFSPDFIYLITRTPAMPRQGDDAKDVLTISDPVSGLSFQVALYGDYRQVRIEIGLAWGTKAVNKNHGCLLLS
jgi:hypothetical protein